MVITHDDDDQDRANGALGMAVSLLAEGVDLELFFVFEGARMASKCFTETVAGDYMTPVRKLFPMLLDADLAMYVCSPCVKKYNIPENEIVAGVQIATLPTVTAEMMARKTIMFSKDKFNGFFQEENIDRPGSHLRLSCQNRSGGSVGRA